MKKISILLLVLLLITGCTTSTPELASPKTLFEFNGKTHTEQDVFNTILEVDYGQVLISHLEDSVIADILETKQYDIKEEAENELKGMQEYADSMSVDFDTMIRYLGFNTLEEFKSQMERSIVLSRYAKELLEDTLDDVIKEYNLYEMKIYNVETESEALTMMRYFQNEYDPEGFEEEFNLDKFDTMIYHNQIKDLNEEMISTLNQLPTDKIGYGALEDGIEVYVYQDGSVDEEKAISAILSQTDYLEKLVVKEIKEKNFKVYNKTLENNLKKDYSAYLK